MIGRSFRIGDMVYEIVGVSEQRFIGTEPGTIPDIFVPTMMSDTNANHHCKCLLRVFVRPNPGVAIEPVREKMYAAYLAYEYDRVKDWTFIPKNMLAVLSREKLLLNRLEPGFRSCRRTIRVR